MGAGQSGSSDSVKIGGKLGKGAYGTVHKGTYQERPVAIKKIRIHRLLLEQARYQAADFDHVQQEFLRECEILSSLMHPHIVEFIGVFDVKGEKALVMELFHETLRDYLVKKKQDGGLEEMEACRISSEIIDGLNYLHSLEPPVVHRNLHGKNVLLTETGQVKISDLGQAKFRPTDLAYLTSMAPGCIPYMPPEVLSNEPRYTEKTDTFSLGVLMLQMVTCLDPNPSLQGIGTEAEIDRRREHIKLIPESHPLRTVIISCLENDLDKRPSAKSLRQTEYGLLYLCAHQPVSFKVVLIGGSYVGRFYFFQRYSYNRAPIGPRAQIGCSFVVKETNIENSSCNIKLKLTVWSVKGSRDPQTGLRLNGVSPVMRGAHGCLLLFDVTRKESLYREAVIVLNEWEKVDGNSLNKKSPTDNRETNDTNIKATPPVILVGTQCDREERREISLKEMEAFVAEHNLNGCIEVSSVTGYNVNEAMNMLVNHMVTNLQLGLNK